MKAIIMAAGKGSRISDKIGGIPKSTLPLLDGTPILRRSVSNMIACGIEPIICVGYQKDKIYETLEGLPVKYYENPFYLITNNIASLWFAREEVGNDDLILTSADLYYPYTFLEKLLESRAELSMIVDSARIESGDFYFHVNAAGSILEYGPDTPLERRDYEYMGLIKVGRACTDRVRALIETYIETGKYDRYFEDMIISLNQEQGMPIDFIDVCGDFWREFDFFEDYEIILNYERGKLGNVK